MRNKIKCVEEKKKERERAKAVPWAYSKVEDDIDG